MSPGLVTATDTFLILLVQPVLEAPLDGTNIRSLTSGEPPAILEAYQESTRFRVAATGGKRTVLRRTAWSSDAQRTALNRFQFPDARL